MSKNKKPEIVSPKKSEFFKTLNSQTTFELFLIVIGKIEISMFGD
jgi:hypothetical protein